MASCSHCAERERENLFDLAGDFAEFADERTRTVRIEPAAELTQLQGEQKKRGQLRGEGLGGGDADLRAGVGVDGAVRFARHHGVDHVADGDSFGAEGDHLALRGKGIGCLAGLRDEQAECVAIGDGIAIAVLAGVVHVDGQAREALDHVLAGKGGVPAGAACGDVDAGGGG